MIDSLGPYVVAVCVCVCVVFFYSNSKISGISKRMSSNKRRCTAPSLPPFSSSSHSQCLSSSSSLLSSSSSSSSTSSSVLSSVLSYSSSSSSKSRLTETPMELLRMIFRYLNLKDNCRTSHTCLYLSRVVRSTPSHICDTRPRWSLMARYQGHIASIDYHMWCMDKLGVFGRIDELKLILISPGVRAEWMEERMEEWIKAMVRFVAEKNVKSVWLKGKAGVCLNNFWSRITELPITHLDTSLQTSEQVESQWLHLPSTLTSYNAEINFECVCEVGDDDDDDDEYEEVGCTCITDKPFKPSAEAWTRLCSLTYLQRLTIDGLNWEWSMQHLGALAELPSLTDLTLYRVPTHHEWPTTTPLRFVHHLTLYEVDKWYTTYWESCARFMPAVNDLTIFLDCNSLLPPLSSWTRLSTLSIDFRVDVSCTTLSLSVSNSILTWPPKLKSLTFHMENIHRLPQLVPHLPRSLVDLSICGDSDADPEEYYPLFSPLFSDTSPLQDLQLLHTTFPIHAHKDFVDFSNTKGWKLR